MPYIKVNTKRIQDYSNTVDGASKQLESIISRYKVIEENLKSAALPVNIHSVLLQLEKESRTLTKMQSFLSEASSVYLKADSVSKTKEYDTANALVSQNLLGTVELTEQETNSLLGDVAKAEKTTVENIVENVDKYNSAISKYVGKADKWFKKLSGATHLVFNKSGKLITLSNFKRNSWLNKLVKWANKGTGIGTKYKPSTLLKTKVLGGLYCLDKIATGVENVTAGIKGVCTVANGGTKIYQILNDDTKDKQQKFCDATAVGVTHATAAAMQVAAPHVGRAVGAAVSAVASPVVGAAVGAAVTWGMDVVAETLTSEKMVNAVSSGIAAVSDAAKAVKEADGFGNKAVATAKLVGTAVVETVKVKATLVVETAKTVVKKVADAGKAVVDAGKKVINWIKKW